MTDSKPQTKSITRRFRRLRRKAMLTQEGLGQHIGLHRTSVNRIERGHAMPRAETLRRFATLEAKHDQPRVHWPKHWK